MAEGRREGCGYPNTLNPPLRHQRFKLRPRRRRQCLELRQIARLFGQLRQNAPLHYFSLWEILKVECRTACSQAITQDRFADDRLVGTQPRGQCGQYRLPDRIAVVVAAKAQQVEQSRRQRRAVMQHLRYRLDALRRHIRRGNALHHHASHLPLARTARSRADQPQHPHPPCNRTGWAAGHRGRRGRWTYLFRQSTLRLSQKCKSRRRYLRLLF